MKLHETILYSKRCNENNTSKAYKIIRELNEELEQRGYIVVPGKVSKRYFYGKVYINEDENIEDL